MAESSSKTKDHGKILFVNKSAASKHLSRSQAQESIAIRSFIQRRNRGVQRLVRAGYRRVGQSDDERSPTTLQAITPSESTSQSADQTSHRASNLHPSEHLSVEASPRRKWVFYVAEAKENNIPYPADRWSGAQTANRKRPDTFPRHVSARSSWTATEQRGVCYFVDVISSTFPSAESAAFWKCLLPPLAETNPIIRTLVIAFSHMYECFDVLNAGKQPAESCNNTALIYCNRAIAQVRESGKSMSQDLLDVTSILMVSFEVLRGNYAAAKACINSALALNRATRHGTVKSRWQSPIPVTGPIPEHHIIAVKKAKMVASFDVFGLDSKRYWLQRSDLHFTFSGARGPFTSLAEFNRSAEVIYSTTLAILNNLTGQSQIDINTDGAATVLQHFAELQNWATASHNPLGFPTDEFRWWTKVPMIKVREAMIVFSCMVLDNNEMSFDHWRSTFENLLDSIEESLLSSNPDPKHLFYHPFSAVLVPPLWLTASRCRDRTLRRRAIHLLRTYRRRETFHDSLVAARLAEFSMMIEERGPAVVETSADVPGIQRIQIVGATYHTYRRQVRLEYMTGQGSVMIKWLDWDASQDYLEQDAPTLLNELLQIHRKYSKNPMWSDRGYIHPMFLEGQQLAVLPS